MFDKPSMLQRLGELPFPATEYWVITGGAMVLYGFRPQTHDIDLGCTTALADRLEQQGYPVSRTVDGSRKIAYADDVEIFENWLEGTVELVDGIPVVSVDGLIEMKRKLGREKDLADIALIEKGRQSGRESAVIGKVVKVTVDRPLGTYHPTHKDIYYPINYGYIEGIMAPDGEEQDAYILGVDVAVKEFVGRVIAMIHRDDDAEEKWVVAPDHMNFTKEEIMKQVEFQEQYFKSSVEM